MMKGNSLVLTGWRVVILSLAVITAGLSGPVYCQTAGTALLLQQTPIQGGTVTPAIGVHNFEPNTQVTLTAVPKPGYQFVCWIGDVSNTAANSTLVYLDSPKIVIAVFERSEYEFLFFEARPQSRPGGGLYPSAADYSRQGGGGGGGKRPHKWRWPTPPEPPEEEPAEDFPVPGETEGNDLPAPEEDGNDFPVPEPIPEPATICLLGLGGLLLRKRAQRKSA